MFIAQQFVFPFDAPGQRQFSFMADLAPFPLSPLFAFCWWLVVRLEILGRPVPPFRPAFRSALPWIVASRRRVGFCLEGCVAFPTP